MSDTTIRKRFSHGFSPEDAISPDILKKKKRSIPREAKTLASFKGVTFLKNTKRWRARINLAGKKLSLGCYSTFEAARGVYLAAIKEHYGSLN